MKKISFTNYGGCYFSLSILRKHIKTKHDDYYGGPMFQLYVGPEQTFLVLFYKRVLDYRLRSCGYFKGFYRITNKHDSHGKPIYK